MTLLQENPEILVAPARRGSWRYPLNVTHAHLLPTLERHPEMEGMRTLAMAEVLAEVWLWSA